VVVVITVLTVLAGTAVVDRLFSTQPTAGAGQKAARTDAAKTSLAAPTGPATAAQADDDSIHSDYRCAEPSHR